MNAKVIQFPTRRTITTFHDYRAGNVIPFVHPPSVNPFAMLCMMAGLFWFGWALAWK